MDENSITVEGSGSAIITDIAIESLPNREHYEDVYPSSDDEDVDDDEEPEDVEMSDEINQLRDRITELEDDLKAIQEIGSNATSRLRFLESYGTTITREHDSSVDKTLDTYKLERQRAFKEEMESSQRQRPAENQLLKARDELLKAFKRHEKSAAKIEKERAKAREAKERQQLDRVQEKARVKKERMDFWPRHCYSVRITLDCTNFTPISSRRGSTSSEGDLVKFASEKTAVSTTTEDVVQKCDLLLSYVTSSAHWQASYDLQLSTDPASGVLCFDAKLHNSTSETWNNCKITLSTSQTNFLGLEDSIPTLVPWRIRLAGKGSSADGQGILQSQEELQMRHRSTHNPLATHRPRHQLFGGPDGVDQDYHVQLRLLEAQNKERLRLANQQNDMSARHQARLGGQPQPPPPPAPSASLFGSAAPVFGSAAQAAGLFGSAAPFGRLANQAAERNMMDMAMPQQLQQQMQPSQPHSAASAHYAMATQSRDVDMLDVAEKSADSLDFQESLVEETGLTTSYEIPGLKTLVPRFTASKQRVARINIANVLYSHTVVAKYKPAAYLKARLKNNSKLTLLAGETSLTLDGSFMGRTKLPRCSSGETVSLSLGVDPAIKVIYPKPSVRRATQGTFSRENSAVYARTVQLHNTRSLAGKPVQMLVLDQIPVSEDERLGVEAIWPMHITKGGSAVKTGAPARNETDDKDWGTAKATLKMEGQVSWDVNLNPGKAVKLVLEYSVNSQINEVVVQC